MSRFTKLELKTLKDSSIEIFKRVTEKKKAAGPVDRIESEMKKLYSLGAFNQNTAKHWANILSELAGKEIKFVASTNGINVPERGSVVVSTAVNNNVLATGSVVLYLGIKQNYHSTLGTNGMTTNNGLLCGQAGDNKNWRYASLEEIEAFYKELEPPRKEGEPDVVDILNRI